MIRPRHHKRPTTELDITSFMNLMIILVPVLLMSMVFSHISVLDLKLPDQAAATNQPDDKKNKQLELVIYPKYMDVNYPAGIRLKRIEKVDGKHDFTMLANVLKEVKRLLREKEIEKRDILILSQPDTDYQTIVSVMDTVRSYKAVVAASVVDAELFPEISLGDAPVKNTLASSGVKP